MNRAQFIIFGAIGVIVLLALLLLTGILPGLKERPPEPFTLIIWGTGDEEELWKTFAGTYKEENVPSATIEYAQKDPKTYEAELLNALAAGRGPDIFFLSDADLARQRDKIAPLADGLLGYRKRDIKNIFADGAAGAIIGASGALLATPLSLDTLALFFNRDHLNAANIPHPPATWEELLEETKILTRLSSVGGIQRSGIAIGTASNVAHAADILAALILQSGGSFIDPATGESAIDSPATVSALNFYTSFAANTKKSYTWNAFFEPSLRAFANGETAMAIGYAADVPAIAAENPQLNFDVASFPQPAQTAAPLTLGRLNLAAVSRTSTNKDHAWRFLLWLQSENPQKTYIDARGLPPARRDLVASKPPRDYLVPFYDQVLSARTLPVAFGDSLGRILDDMIDAVVNRRFGVEQAITRAANELTAIIPHVEQPE